MFTENVFKMFDLNGDEALTFEEFIFATSAQNFDNVHDKLGWLFDNVYDRVSLVFSSHSQYHYKLIIKNNYANISLILISSF